MAVQIADFNAALNPRPDPVTLPLSIVGQLPRHLLSKGNVWRGSLKNGKGGKHPWRAHSQKQGAYGKTHGDKIRNDNERKGLKK